MKTCMTTETWIKKAKAKHGNRYDYSKSVYTYARNKITIICKTHGDFLQIANTHTADGHGCPSCSGNKKISTDEFTHQANVKHGDKNDYSHVKYKNIDTKIDIYCKKHAILYEQTPYHHLNSDIGGCPLCINESRSISNTKSREQFISDSTNVHGNLYDYNESIYEGALTKLSIRCFKHGIFKQTPANHIYGKQGCPSCSYKISKGEIEWLDYHNIKQSNRNITIYINGKQYIVDGLDPITNTIYEYNGDFWHGNPKIFKSADINPKTKTTYGELFESTIEKEHTIINAGYNIVSIWESDFLDLKKPTIKNQ